MQRPQVNNAEQALQALLGLLYAAKQRGQIRGNQQSGLKTTKWKTSGLGQNAFFPTEHKLCF